VKVGSWLKVAEPFYVNRFQVIRRVRDVRASTRAAITEAAFAQTAKKTLKKLALNVRKHIIPRLF